MSPEIYDIVERCSRCGTATVFAVLHQDQDEQGAERISVVAERVPHSTDVCARQVALNREEWPCLF